MKTLYVCLIALCVSAFVLWPILFLEGGNLSKNDSRTRDSGRHREMAGCIPIYKGKLYVLNGRRSKMYGFPKGGVHKGERAYAAAGREAFEEMGIMGKIDTIPIVKDKNVEWFLMEVTKVSEDWEERHERFRYLMTPGEILMHTEVKPRAKRLLKKVMASEGGRRMDARIKSSQEN
jgi:ADP-ribose pyrophosphatase YjhB (NUDIX family)